ncbi:MAG: NAD(P)H-dependent glycerol-3-phosphate dehydrogenase, partial [Pseudomonadota bacterium]
MSARAFNRIGIVGGGAWGTALAQALAASGHAPLLWAYEADTVADINQRRRNEAYLSGIPLSARIGATCDLSDIALCDLILMVPPAQQLRRLSIDLAGDAQLKSDVPLVVCSKGIETSTNALLGRVMSEAAPSNPHAFLSGPSFAADVGRGRPAALTVACADEAIGEAIALTVGSEQLRLYWSDDAIGVQLGGAVKNVLAIAAGIVDGLKLGPSAHAALVTRGFAEMRRFGRALGADEKTLSGL